MTGVLKMINDSMIFSISNSEFKAEIFSQSLININLEATIEVLESEMDDFEIDISISGQELYEIFKINTVICGTILTSQGRFVGMISRHQFLEKISRPFGRSIFLLRNLECLYSFINNNIDNSLLILPSSTLIFDAVQQCIQRSSQLIYEPLVVKFNDGSYKLLNVQKLLIAQAASYKRCMEIVDEKNKEMLKYLQQAKKVTAAAVALENNTYNPEILSEVVVRNDELGQLARVFRQMVQKVKAREQELAAANEELAAAKEQLEAILNAVPGSISWIDSNGLYIGVNRYLAENWNISQESFVGKDVGFLSGNQQLAEFTRQFLASSVEAASEVIGIEVGESLRYYLVAAQKYQQGKATVSVGIDITERKQAEEALRIAEENYRSIFENALEGIFQITVDGQYLKLNPAMARIYGYDSPNEMIANVKEIDSQIYVDSTTRDKFNERMKQHGVVKGFKYQAYRQDKTIIWIEENTRSVRDNYGKLLYYEGIVEDITNRKQKEAELKRQLEELQIEIDEQRRKKEVLNITKSDYFQQLQAEAESMRFDDDWLLK